MIDELQKRSAGAASETREGTVSAEIARLEKAIASLSIAVDELGSRLTTVLGDPDDHPTDPGSLEHPPACATAAQIRDARYRVQHLDRTVAEIVQRVGL